MSIDIGTGSGSAVLRRAAREPETFFIALDADASAMADASRRAARPARKGGRENVIFLAVAAEALPSELCDMSDEASVILPWGSLLSAVLQPASTAFAGLVATLKHGGELTILVSAQERDRVAGAVELNDAAVFDLAAAYERAGLSVVECCPVSRDDIERYSSGWGKRLGIPARRSAWRFRLARS